MQNKKCQFGFTLVEIIIVVAIVAIVAAIALPLLLNHLPNMRVTGAARDVYSIMMQAKGESLQRGENVTIFFDSPNNSYTMFLDNGAGGGVTGNIIRDGGEVTLVTTTFLPDKVSYDPTIGGGDGVTLAGNALVFTPRGIPVSALSPPGSFTLGFGTVGLRAVNSAGVTVRQQAVVMSSAGRLRIQ